MKRLFLSLFLFAAIACAQQCPQGYTLTAGKCVQNGTGGGGAPTGPAGGALTGTYPNPGLAALTQAQYSALAASLGPQLPKFRLALANTKAGVSDSKILCVGDSTCAGYGVGSVYTNSSSWFNRLQLPGVKMAMGLSMAAQNGFFGTQWTAGSWQSGFGGSGFANLSSSLSFGAGAPLVFTPGAGVYDSYDVYYPTDPGYGVFSVTPTGGSTTNINQAVSAGFAKTTVTAGSANSANTISMAFVSGSPPAVSGIEPFLSTTKTVRLGNAGVGGVTSGNWATGGSESSIAALKAYAPDLCLIPLGINDAIASVAVATYIANIQTLITACQVSGDAVLLTPIPSSGGAAVGEALYVPALYALAATNNIPIIDVWGRFGGTWQTALMFDSLHPNVPGYWDIGTFVSQQLTQILGNSSYYQQANNSQFVGGSGGISVSGPIEIGGPTFTMSGCSATSAAGGSAAGKFASGTSGTCTVTITPGVTAAAGWSCWANDLTTPADAIKQTGGTTTTAILSGTTVTADLINFGCIRF